jgi:protease-4
MSRQALLWLVWALCVPLAKGEAVRAADKHEKQEQKGSEAATIAVFRLHGKLKESPTDEMLDLFSGDSTSFRDLVTRMKKAADDPDVKAVVLRLEEAMLGKAQTEELRQALAKLRKADKQVYAHVDSLHMRDFVLLAGASRLSVVPTGDVWITGLYGETPYLRGLLDLLGVKPDFLTCGEYKSAAEIFMRDSPSPQAEEMQNWLFDSLYDTEIKLIAEGRGVAADKVREWVNGAPYSAEKAKAAGLIDAVESVAAFEADLKDKFGKDVVFERKYGKKKAKVDLASPLAFFQVWAELLAPPKKQKSTKPAVGIVYVDGPIMLGKSTSSLFGSAGAYSTDIRKALDEAARDDAIKAVVLRISSPGGSATASEIILEAAKRVKAKKPLIVSMGDVAASGGYYVACGSDLIYADDATITGSIGVVGGKLATRGMWNKIGITFKGYKRGEFADMLSPDAPFTDSQRQRLQAWMDEIYAVFKGHVVEIRGKRLKKPIDEVAGGRVYTGRQALELGLVDKIATLQDAIGHIAEEAKITDYEVRVVPRTKNFLEKLVEDATGGADDAHHLDGADAALATRPASSLLDLAQPHLEHLDPERVAAVKLALRRLQMIQQEGAVLMMPEFITGR